MKTSIKEKLNYSDDHTNEHYRIQNQYYSEVYTNQSQIHFNNR